MIILPMVHLIGLYAVNDETKLAAFITTACLVIDMAVIPVLIGTNLTESGSTIFKGRYSDFGHAWYPHIGRQILTTMVIFTGQPLYNFGIAFMKRSMSRFYFRNFVYTASQNQHSQS